ncbi:sulfatase-like hydrolase/transferase [Nonlabens sp.]|uniref:sulfatase-like hydrolase/transferase n=1 Tax=Nonlabens sp. TaxID=1888209 RepID=UPI003F6A442A
MEILQLLTLLIVSTMITSMFKNKRVRLLVIIFFTFLTLIQIAAVKLTGQVADYKYYEHLTFENLFSVGSFFLYDILIGVVVFILLFLIISFGSNFIHKKLRVIHIGLIALMGIIFLSLDGMIINNYVSTLSLRYSSTSSGFKEALGELPFDIEEYTFKESLESVAGKNLVFISLESFELGFVKDYPELTPHLNKLMEKYSFQEMKQSPGGEWTSASVYMSLTGMPAYFGRNGNEIFHGSQEMQLVTMGDVLSQANYNMSYLLGNKEFSGMDDMLQTMGFTVKSELDFDAEYPKNKWGIHDMDLFKEIKKEISFLEKKKEPYALFASTISTHFPNGVYDERIKGVVPERESNLEFMISAVDYLIGDLMDFMESKGLLENTTFVLVPDHTFMGPHETVNRFEERSLFVISNGSTQPLLSQELYQVSLPRLIIDLLNIETNATFITDFVEGNKNTFIHKHKNQFKNINVSSLDVLHLANGGSIIYEEPFLIIKNEENKVIEQTEVNILKSPTIAFKLDSLKRLRQKEVVLRGNFLEKVKKTNNLVIYIDSSQFITTYFTDNDGITTRLKNKNKVKINPSFFETKIPNFQQGPSPLTVDQSSSKVYITSSSWDAKKISVIYCLDNSEQFVRGMNLVTIEKNGKINTTNFDTHGNPDIIPEMLLKLDDDLRKYQQVFIVAHDSPGDSFGDYKSELQSRKLNKMISLKEREAYIAEVKLHTVKEIVHPLTVQQSYAIPEIVQPQTQAKNDSLSITAYSKDSNRFIAHAGGKIEGKIYTNSLEALNKNYKKGFRIFELDIIKTTDNQYIAAHDWETWKKQASYNGAIPVDLKAFKSQKIYDTLTPLGMKEINAWFAEHKDAILVTDKINEPLDFASKFIDTSRLRMELFSKGSIKQAIENNIIPIVSENVIDELGNQFISFATSHDIKFIAISRKSISKKESLLKELQELKIKCFVYHVNFEKGRDEKYVVENELGKVYGMYADSWDFQKE